MNPPTHEPKGTQDFLKNCGCGFNKKEAVIEMAHETGKELILKCYPCFMKWAKKNKDILGDHIRMDL